MILVTGATGFVGSKIMELCDDTVAAPSLRNVTEDEVRSLVEDSNVDTIIHTAAISNVGFCDADPDASYKANVQLPVYLAKAAQGRKLVCFSSDMVYVGMDGEGPYNEEFAKPVNTYSKHKLEMEQRVLDICPDAVMLRAEWMYDFSSTKPNYFTNLINAKGPVRFSSQNFRGLTYVKEVAENMEKVIALPGGVYNFGSETNKSMFEVACAFIQALGLSIDVEDIPPLHNLWMDCSKARKYGVVFSEELEGLLRCARDCGMIR